MAYSGNITVSKHGRLLGLENMSTTVSGGSRGEKVYLVGPEALRADATTADTTGTNLHPFGVSFLTSQSSGVYTIDPPVPGVSKVIATLAPSSAPVYVKTANDEGIISSEGSTHTTIKLSSAGGVCIRLEGLTTAYWGLINGSTAAGHVLTTST